MNFWRWLLGWRVAHQRGRETYMRNIFTGRRRASRRGPGKLDMEWVATGKFTSPLIPEMNMDRPN